MDQSSQKENRDYDLEERTAVFAESAIELARSVKRSVLTIPLISQFIRSATSIGANYCEAESAVSKKDFRNRIGFCRKESRETMYWLRMIAKAEPLAKEQARQLWLEAKQLHLIFAKSFRTAGEREP